MESLIRIYIYNANNKFLTKHGKYKTLDGALKNAIRARKYYFENNHYWMHIWIGLDKFSLMTSNMKNQSY